ncbi:hypothetical protein [Pectobacterium versatile]|uniref:hypothetical protein n=1 Tax=Pectobacterium versatile TaxID=2488639 RepID=UPI001B38B97B|nr:hypothetical protein [Pectobacterium versatile]MBQ4777695.1 hypothetical protein [Pectobacterium versatile]
MSTEQMRSEFEEWFKPKKIEMMRNGASLLSIKKLYKSDWQAWQASRAALVVELPETVAKITWHYAGSPPDDFYECVDIARHADDKSVDGSDPIPVYADWQIKETLRAAGITVKE